MPAVEQAWLRFNSNDPYPGGIADDNTNQDLGFKTRVTPGFEGQVLVVDDSELTRDILVNLVSRLGYEVIEAVDGQDALRRLGEGPVDLILTDLEMPVLDGFELLDQVRASPHLRELPVVVCSTRGSDEDKRRAADLGADAYVVKSRFDQDELDRTLGRLMGAGVR